MDSHIYMQRMKADLADKAVRSTAKAQPDSSSVNEKQSPRSESIKSTSALLRKAFGRRTQDKGKGKGKN
jgi:hypothetical protein